MRCSPLVFCAVAGKESKKIVIIIETIGADKEFFIIMMYF